MPLLQAQAAEARKSFDNDDTGVAPAFGRMPAPIETVTTVRPVATAMSNHDEFWRKVPLWENVSAADFLSYRWSVSLAQLPPRGTFPY
jgi:lysine 2,3-aminomutase